MAARRQTCKGHDRLVAGALLFSIALLVPAVVRAATPRVSGLRCDALVDPLGIDDAHPSLSWRIEDSSDGARQTAYRVEVFSSAHSGKPGSTAAAPAVWDSGRVTSSVSTGVTYQGTALETSKRYYWRVEVWGKDGQAYPLSETGWWETGLMEQSAWRAKWIGYESAEPAQPAHLRRGMDQQSCGSSGSRW